MIFKLSASTLLKMKIFAVFTGRRQRKIGENFAVIYGKIMAKICSGTCWLNINYKQNNKLGKVLCKDFSSDVDKGRRKFYEHENLKKKVSLVPRSFKYENRFFILQQKPLNDVIIKMLSITNYIQLSPIMMLRWCHKRPLVWLIVLRTKNIHPRTVNNARVCYQNCFLCFSLLSRCDGRKNQFSMRILRYTAVLIRAMVKYCRRV